MTDLRCLMGLHGYVVQRIEGEHRAHPRTYQECRRCGNVPADGPRRTRRLPGGAPARGGFKVGAPSRTGHRP
jgi:hypothetical protein